MKNKTSFRQYRIEQKGLNPKTGKPFLTDEAIVEASDPFVALSKHRKRGVNGLGSGWTFTRQPDGWIVAVNTSKKTLERDYARLKEVGWVRGMNAL